MSRDNKSHTLTLRALRLVKESARLFNMDHAPEQSPVIPKRVRNARRIAQRRQIARAVMFRAIIVLGSVLSIAPAQARGHGGNHGHLTGGHGGGGAVSALHAHLRGG